LSSPFLVNKKMPGLKNKEKKGTGVKGKQRRFVPRGQPEGEKILPDSREVAKGNERLREKFWEIIIRRD